MSEDHLTEQLTAYLAQLRSGDETVFAALWDLVNDCLTVLARKMKREHYRSVGAWEQTEDIAQNVRIRLFQAVKDCSPATPREFFGLVNLQIRRELIDTIRRRTGRTGERELTVQFPPDVQPIDDTFDPELLGRWLEFHESIEALPEMEREVVELLWYQELTQEQAAAVIGVDPGTVKRRWRTIRQKLENVAPFDALSDS